MLDNKLVIIVSTLIEKGNFKPFSDIFGTDILF